MNRNGGIGWYVTFAGLVVGIFLVVGYYTGVEVVGAAARFVWNLLAFGVNSALRLSGGLLAALAKGIGLRRLSRLSTAIGSIGLGYAGSLILSDDKVRKAHSRRERLKAFFTVLRSRWQTLHLAWKLVIVAVLITSQFYLHTLLIVFPVAFLVPVVRRLWVRIADLVFGRWYWKRFGRTHRAAVAWLRTLPPFRQLIGAARVTRLRYLCAWRLWKYDPRYRRLESDERWISLIEPMRLWWRGELDRYFGRPLLAGTARRRTIVTSATRPDA